MAQSQPTVRTLQRARVRAQIQTTAGARGGPQRAGGRARGVTGAKARTGAQLRLRLPPRPRPGPRLWPGPWLGPRSDFGRMRGEAGKRDGGATTRRGDASPARRGGNDVTRQGRATAARRNGSATAARRHDGGGCYCRRRRSRTHRFLISGA